MDPRNCSPDNITDSPAENSVMAFTVVTYSMKVVCITGNLLVLVNFVTFRSLRQTRNYFSINMAVSDIQAGFFTIAIIEGMFAGRYEKPFPGCEFISCYPTVILLASALSVLCSTLDRLIALKIPLRYTATVTQKRILLTLGAIWSVAVLVGIVPLYGVLKGWVQHCQGSYEANMYFFAFVFLGIPIPIAIAVSSIYLYISRIARKHNENFRRFAPGFSDVRTKTLSKSARVCLAICLTMVICWIPMALAYIILDHVPNHEFLMTFKVTRTLSALPHAINPWIYTLRNAEFRDASKKLFKKSSRKIRSCFQKSSSSVHPAASDHGTFGVCGSLSQVTD